AVRSSSSPLRPRSASFLPPCVLCVLCGEFFFFFSVPPRCNRPPRCFHFSASSAVNSSSFFPCLRGACFVPSLLQADVEDHHHRESADEGERCQVDVSRSIRLG